MIKLSVFDADSLKRNDLIGSYTVDTMFIIPLSLSPFLSLPSFNGMVVYAYSATYTQNLLTFKKSFKKHISLLKKKNFKSLLFTSSSKVRVPAAEP